MADLDLHKARNRVPPDTDGMAIKDHNPALGGLVGRRQQWCGSVVEMLAAYLDMVGSNVARLVP